MTTRLKPIVFQFDFHHLMHALFSPRLLATLRCITEGFQLGHNPGLISKQSSHFSYSFNILFS